jgi:hypothetical protein
MSRYVSFWEALPALRATTCDAARIVQPGPTSETRTQEALRDLQTSARNAAIREAHANGVQITELCERFKLPEPAVVSIVNATEPPQPRPMDTRQRSIELLLSDAPIARYAFRTRLRIKVHDVLRREPTRSEGHLIALVTTALFHLVDDGED